MDAFEAFDLTPLDHIIPPCYVRFFLGFPVKDVATALAQLQSGTALLIEQLPFLAGDLAPSETPGARKGLLGIRPSGPNSLDSGILSVKAHDSLLHEGTTTASHTEQRGTADESYLPLPFFPEVGKPVPIFRLQINTMRDGIILGFVFHHGAVDATGLGVVIQQLADCCREGGTSNDLSGQIRTGVDQQNAAREQLTSSRADPSERLDHRAEFPVVASLPADMETIKQILMQTANEMSTRYFRLSSKVVDELKQRCNQALAVRRPHEKAWVSSNDIVVSLLWMCLNRSRYSGDGPSPTASEICMAVNVRGRVQPPLPATYIGNGIVLLRRSIDMQTFLCPQEKSSIVGLCKEPQKDEFKPWQLAICEIASTIRRGLNCMSDTYVRSVNSYLGDVEDLSTLSFSQSDFHMSSWREIGVYQADFGGELGYPADMRVPDGMIDGQFYILPKRKQEDAFWEVHVTIHRDTMATLCADKLWSAYTSSPAS